MNNKRLPSQIVKSSPGSEEKENVNEVLLESQEVDATDFVEGKLEVEESASNPRTSAGESSGNLKVEGLPPESLEADAKSIAASRGDFVKDDDQRGVELATIESNEHTTEVPAANEIPSSKLSGVNDGKQVVSKLPIKPVEKSHEKAQGTTPQDTRAAAALQKESLKTANEDLGANDEAVVDEMRIQTM